MYCVVENTSLLKVDRLLFIPWKPIVLVINLSNGKHHAEWYSILRAFIVLSFIMSFHYFQHFSTLWLFLSFLFDVNDSYWIVS